MPWLAKVGALIGASENTMDPGGKPSQWQPRPLEQGLWNTLRYKVDQIN